MVEETWKKAALEAILFVAGDVVTVTSLNKATDIPAAEIRQLMSELIAELRDRRSGIIIAEIAEGYQMLSSPDTGTWVKKFKNIHQSGKLSQPAIETLAIIAYKQPITKIEVDQLRGVNSDGAVRSLLDKRLVKIVGKKETPGRPFLYGTTIEFLQYFGLKSLAELPPINQFLKDEAA
ncbi:MAG: SMC-Scp complex subunit ScpB [Nitrospirales bacterium]|nr:SMC-Scp complex subunit ScpB [Nitrospirales bacterium]